MRYAQSSDSVRRSARKVLILHQRRAQSKREAQSHVKIVISPPHSRVVLVSTRNPLNIGAAARAMANFGLEDLRVVNPYEVAFREAVSAVGGAHVLKSARVFETVAEAVSDCSLVVGTTAAQHRELQQPIEPVETGMERDAGACGARGAAVRLGEVRAIERRYELIATR